MSVRHAPTLLMTATIDPRGMPMVARADPQLRLRDYEWALSGWLASGSVSRIVFCENSGHDLGSLRRIAAAHPDIEVEFLALHDEQAEISRGKGYAELGIIRLALAQSRLLAASALLLKCTGRLRVQNSPRILRQIATDQFDVMCTLKRRRRFADSRLFAATPAFIREQLIPRANEIDDRTGVYLEHVLARAVRGAVAEGQIWRPFSTLPRIAGISGTRGLVLTDSSAMSLFKACCHRVRNLVQGN
jgi:hypothetical protein